MALLFCTAALLYWALTISMGRDDDLFLADKVHVMRAILRERPNDFSAIKEEVELETAARRYEQFFERLIDENGREQLSTPGMDALLPAGLFPKPIPPNAEPGAGPEIRVPNGRQFLLLAADAPAGTSGHVWVMQIGVDHSHDEALLAAYKRWLWLVLGMAVLACPIVGHRIAKREIRPVEEIGRTAELTGSQNLRARIDPAGYPVELAALAQTFNAMLDRLEDAFSRLSRFSADIAHELRTPVHNIRGEAEVILAKGRSHEEYRDALGSCLEESARLSDLIESLLFLARAESPGTHVVRECVDVRKELERLQDYYDALAADAGLSFAVETNGEIAADLDRVLFQRAIANVVENAIAHTPNGGAVRVLASVKNETISIAITDTGDGIPSEHIAHVFDRFYRADSSRSSRGGHMGLGLAIVHAIVELHGGSARVSSQPGRGTIVELNFPLRVSGAAMAQMTKM